MSNMKKISLAFVLFFGIATNTAEAPKELLRLSAERGDIQTIQRLEQANARGEAALLQRLSAISAEEESLSRSPSPSEDSSVPPLGRNARESGTYLVLLMKARSYVREFILREDWVMVTLIEKDEKQKPTGFQELPWIPAQGEAEEIAHAIIAADNLQSFYPGLPDAALTIIGNEKGEMNNYIIAKTEHVVQLGTASGERSFFYVKEIINNGQWVREHISPYVLKNLQRMLPPLMPSLRDELRNSTCIVIAEGDVVGRSVDTLVSPVPPSLFDWRGYNEEPFHRTINELAGPELSRELRRRFESRKGSIKAGDVFVTPSYGRLRNYRNIINAVVPIAVDILNAIPKMGKNEDAYRSALKAEEATQFQQTYDNIFKAAQEVHAEFAKIPGWMHIEPFPYVSKNEQTPAIAIDAAFRAARTPGKTLRDVYFVVPHPSITFDKKSVDMLFELYRDKLRSVARATGMRLMKSETGGAGSLLNKEDAILVIDPL